MAIDLLVLVAILLVCKHRGVDIDLPKEDVLALSSVIAVAIGWHLHLLMRGASYFWGLLLAIVLAVSSIVSLRTQFQNGAHNWGHACACAIFLYALLWAFGRFRDGKNLQGLMSIALVLPFGIVAGPVTLALCALFAALFSLSCRKMVGGLFNLFLVIWTPLVLCVSWMLLLSFLFHGAMLRIGWLTAVSTSEDAAGISVEYLWPCILGGIAILLRFVLDRNDRADLVYVCFIAAVLYVHVLPQVPNDISLLDFSSMLIAGGAALFATAYPQDRRECLILNAGFLGCCSCLLFQQWAKLASM